MIAPTVNRGTAMVMALVGVAPNNVLLPRDMVLTLEDCTVKVTSIEDRIALKNSYWLKLNDWS